MAQNNNTLPYYKIETYPDHYSMGTVVARMIDGLGYRYYWASLDLRSEDLNYSPGNDGKTAIETLKHIYELSQDILRIGDGVEFKRPRVKVPDTIAFTELRSTTLRNLYAASEKFSSMSEADFLTLKIVFAFETSSKEYPFWHFLNGQLSDAIYHTGQIASFRRTSGNPVSKEMNVFMCGQ